ncbi:MAG: MbnP family protein [Bacteroidota bacterium]|nr:MbnP family protein [Bacteroidota bacterium]
MKNLSYLSIILTIIILISCKTSNSDNPTPSTPTGNLYMHIHSFADTNEIEYNKVLTLSNGRKIIINKAQMFISEIQLSRNDASSYNVEGMYFLKINEVENSYVGKVPVGNYNNIQFSIGLSEAINDKTPNLTDSLLQIKDMWLSNEAKPNSYAFILFQGKIDTSKTKMMTESQLTPFIYKIGTKINKSIFKLTDTNIKMVANQDAYVHMYINYAKLLENIDLNVPTNLQIITIADNSSDLTKNIYKNIPKMISTE